MNLTVTGLCDSDLTIIKKALGIHIKIAWLFGSRAKGTQQKYSDIDLLLDPDYDLNLQDLAKIRDYLEESPLPFKVDLVLRSQLAASYIDSIMSERVRLTDLV
jgi:predicted nucleotidyltransferase